MRELVSARHSSGLRARAVHLHVVREEVSRYSYLTTAFLS